MFDQILSEFASSPQAQAALAALQAQGHSPETAQALLGHGLSAAAESMSAQTAGQAQPTESLWNIFGGHSGREFLLGLTAGIARGDGIFGSLQDGAMGLVAGHVGEVLGQRAGLDPATAGSAAAAMTPFILQFVHEKLAGQHG